MGANQSELNIVLKEYSLTDGQGCGTLTITAQTSHAADAGATQMADLFTRPAPTNAELHENPNDVTLQFLDIKNY